MALVRSVMPLIRGFNVVNMLPTETGNLWTHGPDNAPERWVRATQVIEIPATPELRNSRHWHYVVPEMRAYGWGDNMQ